MSSHKFLHNSHKVDDLTGTDYTNDRVDPWKSLIATFSARPKKDVSTTFTLTNQHEYTKEGAKVESYKTEAKVSVNKDLANTHWTFANDKFVAKAVKHDLANEQETKWHVNAELSGEFKPAKDEWKVTGCASGHTPDFSGVTAHYTQTAEINQKKEITLKTALDFAHEKKHHIGGYLEHDTKEFKRLWAQIAFTPEKHELAFIRADVLKHLVSAGVLHKFSGNDYTHGLEVTYDAADGAKGFQGFPVAVKSGAHYALSDATHLKTCVEIGEHYGGHLKVEHKINQNWTVEAHQEFCSAKLKVAGGPYDLGFKVHYKL